TQQSQGTSPSGAVGSLQVVQQNAAVANVGIAVANTGGNVAIGNSSTNLAGAAQVGSSGLGGAVNSGKAANASNGTATISTGDATAIGNHSATTIDQSSSATGALGGILIVGQNALVTNSGIALANSGGNIAVGNASTNATGLLQGAVSGLLGLATNSGTASNASDGRATIHTGNASATGNHSDTKVTQSSSGAAGGAPPGGLMLVSQNAAVLNGGLAAANSGGNAAIGNVSTNLSGAAQGAATGLGFFPVVLSPIGVASNSAEVGNASDGSASIYTGDAGAVGNDSDTLVEQSADGNAAPGVIIDVQAAVVANGGAAFANSGGNAAIGNASLNLAGAAQGAGVGVGVVPVVLAGSTIASNSLDLSNSSGGSATIHTGDASATGNHSDTWVAQDAGGDPEGIGVNLQVAGVLNTGIAAANSGGNLAVGNASFNAAGAVQGAGVGVGIVPVVTALGATASNSASVSNESDGSAWIDTGDASATGNRSATHVSQGLDSDELVIAPQIAGVVNAGAAAANSGGNVAVGNIAPSVAAAGQLALTGAGGVPVVAAGQAVASNSLDVGNASDGSASIKTGDADAWGNVSTTDLSQHVDASIDGAGVVVAPQVAFVANTGIGLANSGGNVAVGNVAPSIAVGAQVAAVAAGEAPVLLALSAVASNQASVTNASDGSATIHTGDATATGNWSSTALSQEVDADIDGLGLVVTPQVAGVLNAGIGVSNSGLNAAVGNASLNAAGAGQAALISSLADPNLVIVAGPATASNSADVSNASDGSAKVKTGDATATGNKSDTHLGQHVDGSVSGLGLVVGPQIAGVANVGLGVANSGLNAAVGNASLNLAGAGQLASIASLTGTPFNGLILGPATAANSADVSNESDGDACVCTGDATASGNVSSTHLSQGLDLDVGTGALIVSETGGVLNAGLGVANSGLNAAIGNSSTNVAASLGVATINDALLALPIALGQTANNGGGASNSSAGTALVASGNATGTGNESSTDFVQAAEVDGGFAVSSLLGGTTNNGVGLANSGLNFGLGNNSTNVALDVALADGAGIVSNQAEASNESDGTAIIGNPEDCDDEKVTPPSEEPGKPGAPGLPRTGAELEVQAAVGLMLLLLGFGLTRQSRRYAFRR
ncbi:MAG TPA: hypothetical protein VJ804_03660, partial [Acidimicrobiales bacterium]|nr:hypothetical protein [Acidimicrobiales bacterium]